MKTVPITTANVPGSPSLNARFMARNCDALANKLATLSDNQIVADQWVDLRGNIPKADALGVAVLSHVVEGLQFTFNNPANPRYGVQPLINGHPSTFADAAVIFFGEDVRRNVFLNRNLSRKGMIEGLRKHASQYRNMVGHLRG